MIAKVSFAAILTALMIGTCQAGLLTFEHTIDSESAFYDPSAPGFSLASVEQSIAPINVDFSVLGDTTVCFKYTSPTGFHAKYPEAGTLEFIYLAGSTLGAGSVQAAMTTSFEGFSGTPLGAASFASMSFAGATGDRASATVVFPVEAGAQFSFDSVSFCGDLPASLDTIFPNVAGTSSIAGSIEPASSDHGQFVTLQPTAVPEPSAFLLVGLVGLLTSYRYRRKR